MSVLVEQNTVKETEHLEPILHRIKDAIFGHEALIVDWRRGHMDQGALVLRFGDGLLWLPAKHDLWLIELEWKLGSNYLQQVQTFAEGRVDRDRLREALCQCLEENAEPLSIPNDSLTIASVVDLTMVRYVRGGVLRPNMWVVLGHEGDNIDKLVKEYTKKTDGFFRAPEQEYLITTVRLFSDEESDFMLLDNFRRDGQHSAVLSRLEASSERSDRAAPFSDSIRSSISSNAPVRASKADRVWRWLIENHPGLQRENVWLRIQPGFNEYHDFEIAWKHQGTELMVVVDNSKFKPKEAAKKAFPIIGNLGKNVAQTLGKFIDVSKDPREVIAKCSEVDIERRRTFDAYDRRVQEMRPCTDFFENAESHKEIKGIHGLWTAFLERRVLTSKDLEDLTGLTGKGRPGKLDHKLTGYSIVDREGLEFRVRDEAIPYIKEMLGIVE